MFMAVVERYERFARGDPVPAEFDLYEPNAADFAYLLSRCRSTRYSLLAVLSAWAALAVFFYTIRFIPSGFLTAFFDLGTAGIVLLITILALGFMLPGMAFYFAVSVTVTRLCYFRRASRFFESPFCFYCEYEIPELVCTPAEAYEAEGTLRCTECGKDIPRIVATRSSG